PIGIRRRDQVAGAAVAISLEREPSALGGGVLHLDRGDPPAVASRRADEPPRTVADLDEAPLRVVVRQRDSISISILNGGEADTPPALLDVREQPPDVVAHIDDKPPGFTAEPPAPFADQLLPDCDHREIDCGAMFGPHGDRG